MRFCTRIAALLAAAVVPGFPEGVVHHYHVVGDDPGSWPAILGSIGLTPGAPDIAVIRQGEPAPPSRWIPAIDQGSTVILEGDSELARALGFQPTGERVVIQSLLEERAPKLPIIWEKQLEAPVCSVPEKCKVFARERWTKTPLVAGFRRGKGAVLWVATPPGERGYERYPYLLQALVELGMQAPLESRQLWAFFDTAYRSRVDVDYFAERWRRSGIAGLHVAAWQHFDPDPQRDEFLHKLIQACHQRAILVYAWFEFPHVSEKFWRTHPEWREKTALGQDAHLDWRKLMNLADPACARELAQGVRRLIQRFDWDGVNLAELYFESLEGASNLARFTPFNTQAMGEFQALHGISAMTALRDPAGIRKLLDFRADLAHRLQEQWLREFTALRGIKPDLDIVLTHIDDRLDAGMRDALGADAARALSLMKDRGFTFLIEDPATLWHLGPQRYLTLWEAYRALAKQPERLGVDINIVERYQDVYPTKQQTGIELFQLVHTAAGVFPRVALYFENSILKQDVALLPAAAANVQRLERVGRRLVVETRAGVGVRWQGAAVVDGRVWPAGDGNLIWLTPGPHVIEPASGAAPMHLTDFSGWLQTAVATERGIEFSYQSDSRALAILDRKPVAIHVDGEPSSLPVWGGEHGFVLPLPRGQHIVTLEGDLPERKGKN